MISQFLGVAVRPSPGRQAPLVSDTQRAAQGGEARSADLDYLLGQLDQYRKHQERLAAWLERPGLSVADRRSLKNAYRILGRDRAGILMRVEAMTF